MNGRLIKGLVAVGLFAFVFAFLFGCQKTPPPAEKAPAGAPAPGAAAPQTAALSQAPVDALSKFVEVRRTQPVDFQAMKAIFTNDLAGYVKQIDTRLGKSLASDAKAALDKCIAGQDVPGNMQIAEKSIQRAFILDFLDGLDALGAGGNGTALARVKATAPVLRSAAARRSDWVGKGDQYPALFDAALSKLEQASGDPAARSAAKAEMLALMYKTIALSVLYELDGLEKARGSDANVASEKHQEARLYYLSVLPEHEKRDPDGAKALLAQFSGPTDGIDVEFARKALANAFASEFADVDPAKIGMK